MDRRTNASTGTVAPAGVAGIALVSLAGLVLAAVAVGLVAVPGATPSGEPGPATATGTEAPTAAATATEGATRVVDVEGRTTVTVTYASAGDTRRFTVTDVDPALVDADADWAYLPASSLTGPLERAGDDHAGGVVRVGRWALVGELAVASEPVNSGTVTVVAPAGMDVDPGRKAGFLSSFVSPYAFAPTDAGRTTFAVAPDALPSDGRMYGDTGYVTGHAFWDGDVSSVWVHEYVHARQRFELTEEMRWFREASATYLAARVMEEQYDPVTETDVRERIDANPTYPETPLASQAAWNATHADYHRGARLLYAVDGAVRDGSDGAYTFVDVLRTMNRRDGPITVAEFVRIVESRSGQGEGWVREAITTTIDLDDRVDRESDGFDQ